MPGENEDMGQERITQLRKSFLSSTLNEFLGLVNKNITIPLFYRTSELIIHMHWNGELLFTPKKMKRNCTTLGMNVVVSLKLSMNNISERKFTYNALIFDWARGKVFNWEPKKPSFWYRQPHFHNLAFFKFLSWYWYVHDFWTYYTV